MTYYNSGGLRIPMMMCTLVDDPIVTNVEILIKDENGLKWRESTIDTDYTNQNSKAFLLYVPMFFDITPSLCSKNDSFECFPLEGIIKKID